MNAIPDDADDLNFEGVIGLCEMKRVSVKRRARDLQEFCCMKRQKMAGTLAEVVELVDEFVNHGGESEAQVADDTASVMQSAVESEVVSFSTNLEKAREKEASASCVLEAYDAASRLD